METHGVSLKERRQGSAIISINGARLEQFMIFRLHFYLRRNNYSNFLIFSTDVVLVANVKLTSWSNVLFARLLHSLTPKLQNILREGR